VVGFPYVKAVTDLFVVGPNKTTNGSTIIPPNLLMSFTVRNRLFDNWYLILEPDDDDKTLARQQHTSCCIRIGILERIHRIPALTYHA
jgi:hypothetical protein